MATAVETQSPPAWRRYAWLAVRLALVAVAFVIIFRALDVQIADVAASFRQVNWWWVLAGYGIWALSIGVASVRWKLLLDVVRPGISVPVLTGFNFVGIFYAQFLPGVVSGDAVKGYYLARDGEEKVGMIASALMDRLLGITVNGLVGLVALAASPLVRRTLALSDALLWAVTAAAVTAPVVGVVVVRAIEGYAARLPGPIRTVYEPVRMYAHHIPALAGAGLMSIAYFGMWALALWALAAAAGLGDLGFLTVLLLLAVVNVAQFLPISVGGAGVREGAVTFLLVNAYAVDETTALTYALLITLTTFGLAALGGILVLTDYRGGQQENTST